MHILIAIIGAAASALYWYSRMRSGVGSAREMADDAADVVQTVLNAPRRIAFRRQTGAHPVEGIDDPRVAVAAIAQAVLELADLPTKEDRDRLTVLIRKELSAGAEEAEEMQVLGRWLTGQCGGADRAVRRISKKLYKMDGRAHQEVLFNILLGLAGPDGLDAAQHGALEDIRIALRLPPL